MSYLISFVVISGLGVTLGWKFRGFVDGPRPGSPDPIFICSKCGTEFDSFPPPGETRPDDPAPLCSTCIDKLLDAYNDSDTPPIPGDTVKRMVDYAVGRNIGRRLPR